jgi:hypothetical protein
VATPRVDRSAAHAVGRDSKNKVAAGAVQLNAPPAITPAGISASVTSNTTGGTAEAERSVTMKLAWFRLGG